MQVPPNSMTPRWIVPTEIYDPNDENHKYHYHLKRCGEDESFVFLVTEANAGFKVPPQSRDYVRFDVYGNYNALTDNTVMMWAQDYEKRFTGCDPNDHGPNRGFEMILTPMYTYYRDPFNLVVHAVENSQPVVSLMLGMASLDLSDPSQTVMFETALALESGPNLEIYIDLPGGGGVNLSPDLPFSPVPDESAWERYTLLGGIGQPPKTRPGLNPRDFWRPLVKQAWHDR